MRRPLVFFTALLAMLALAGCGAHHSYSTQAGGHGRQYTVTINGKHVRRPHPPGFGLPPKGVPLPRALPPTSTPTVEQFDSVDYNIPSGAAAWAGYTSGSWPTYSGFLRTYPGLHAPIAVYDGGPLVSTGSGRIMCLDIEPGDATPSSAGPWARGVLLFGDRPCEYSSLSEMSSVRSNLAAYGLLGKVLLWDANWTYGAHLDSGYACTQWTDRSRGLNLDESTCALSFYAPPGPPPDPYAVFQDVTYDLGHGINANEKTIVKGWNDRHCLNPTRRPVCGFLRYRLALLDGRLKAVANRSHPADWSTGHRYRRARYIERELTMTRAPWPLP